MADPWWLERDAELGVAKVKIPVDRAFRRALMVGVPPNLRSKMQEALAAYPDKRTARAHSVRYFGDEFEDICGRAIPLAEELHNHLNRTFNLPGFLDWLTVTGYGDDYRMIKVFAAWAEMISAPKQAANG